jgi:hypothetical protein
LSPRLLVELLEFTGPKVAALMEALPPEGEALFAVAWAGESRSENWLDTGRELTERWHHQMRIREAIGAPLLLDSPWSRPVIEISLRALPPAYAGSSVAQGSVAIRVEGYAVVAGEGWAVYRGAPPRPRATLAMDAHTAWRLLFNALPIAEARARIAIAGDPALAAPFLAARAVMVRGPAGLQAAPTS